MVIIINFIYCNLGALGVYERNESHTAVYISQNLKKYYLNGD